MTALEDGLQPADLTNRSTGWEGLWREVWWVKGSGELTSERSEEVEEKGERVGMAL
jgi:hypothetical protein